MSFPKIFSEIVAHFSKFPGIGRRSAERMAFHVLKMPPAQVRELARKIEEIHTYIHPCPICNNFCAQDICHICLDERRDTQVLCIVEEPKDILAIEKTGAFNGLYYVLLGSISPIDGVDADELNIGKLLNRLQQRHIQEVIISTDPDNDGELTAQFLIEKISPFNVKIFRIAMGVPMGTQIEYIDSATLGRALADKRPL